MNIDDDINHIAQFLLDQNGKCLNETQSTIYCSYDPKRIESDPFYKNDNSIPKMAELELIKIVRYETNYKPIDTSTIRKYYYYQVEFSPEKLKEFIKKRKGKKNTSSQESIVDIGTLPFCIEEGDKGYLKYSKYGQKIFIGDVKSRHYRFLQHMLESNLINSPRTIESVFEKIRIQKDETNPDLAEYLGNTPGKLEKIEFCIKELQKDGKMHEKIKFNFDLHKTRITTKIVH